MTTKNNPLVRSSGSGQAAEGGVGQSSQTAKSISASALSQRPREASKGSQRVIKDVSNEHRDALKRLVDR
jgi:gas vesicle protein